MEGHRRPFPCSVARFLFAAAMANHCSIRVSARWAHNPKVARSNLAPATKSSNKTKQLRGADSSGPFAFMLYYALFMPFLLEQSFQSASYTSPHAP
jgi:hypothetical protein